MPSPIVIRALVEAARKRGWLNVHVERLLYAATPIALEGVGALRAWLSLQPDCDRMVTLLGTDAGDVIGGYMLLAHLADGGMGSAWLGADAAGSLVVLKRIRRDRVSDEIIQRFDREARIISELQHPHVVRSLSWGRGSNGDPFLAMEFIHGGDLQGLIHQQKKLDEKETLTVLREVALGLGAAHAMGLIHRDIKPSNIFIAPDGHVKLADFGLARSAAIDRTMMTQVGQFVGSPRYVAPEQMSALYPELDIRCDLYALGCVGFHCLVGRTPFIGSYSEIVYGHLHDPPPDISELAPSIGPHVVTLIQRLLQKDREKRHSDPVELVQDLDRAISLSSQGGKSLSSKFRIKAVATLNKTSAVSKVSDRPKSVQPHVSSSNASCTHTSPPSPRDVSNLNVIETRCPDSQQLAGCIGLRAIHGLGPVVILWPQESLVLGKLRGPPVELCLRDYPVEQYQARCNRLSRQHLRLWVDAFGAHMQDLGSLNGSLCDGVKMPTNQTITLLPSQSYALSCASVIHLRLQAQVSKVGSRVDSVIITREKNRQNLVYALVPHRIRIGGVHSDIPMMSIMKNGCCLENREGAWWWKPDDLDMDIWQPLLANTDFSQDASGYIWQPADLSWMD